MYYLYHFPLCPFSRQIRVTLKEKSIDYKLVLENYWERRKEFAALNPALEVPVLVDLSSNHPIADVAAISEYLEELYPNPTLLGATPLARAEVRRLTNWFNHKFFQEVTKYIIQERILNFHNNTTPDSQMIRMAQANICYHLDYIAYLLKNRQWLAIDQFSLADIAAASQLSVLDYFGDVPWEHNHYVKDWYAIVKSRPCFRLLLDDRIHGFAPSKHYVNLDF